MILFVFEGKKREPDIFKTLEFLFFPKEQNIVYSFGNNLYELYRQLQELDGAGDIVSLLREINKGNPDNPFDEDVKSSDFSEIFLFFDYDFQNKFLTLEQMNQQVTEMLDVFDDETENGKLYINYPMLEAIRYTKALPDEQYVTYTVSRTDCCVKGFKNLVQRFSAYGSLDFIVLDLRRKPSTIKKVEIEHNWELLKIQSVSKANLLCNEVTGFPSDKDSISQGKVFQAQLSKHILPKDEVAILCAFPIFIFDYFKR